MFSVITEVVATAMEAKQCHRCPGALQWIKVTVSFIANGPFKWPSVILAWRRRVGGTSCGSAGADRQAGRQLSAYLIRSRPSGRKINSLARCYCSAGGRAATRAQHNIYTVGLRRTLAPASAYTCSAFRDARTRRSEAGVNGEKTNLHLRDEQRLKSVFLCLSDQCTCA